MSGEAFAKILAALFIFTIFFKMGPFIKSFTNKLFNAMFGNDDFIWKYRFNSNLLLGK